VTVDHLRLGQDRSLPAQFLLADVAAVQHLGAGGTSATRTSVSRKISAYSGSSPRLAPAKY
jgi:hypothetical protein